MQCDQNDGFHRLGTEYEKSEPQNLFIYIGHSDVLFLIGKNKSTSTVFVQNPVLLQILPNSKTDKDQDRSIIQLERISGGLQSNFLFQAALAVRSDQVAQVFTHSVVENYKVGDCMNSLGNMRYYLTHGEKLFFMYEAFYV